MGRGVSEAAEYNQLLMLLTENKTKFCFLQMNLIGIVIF